MCRLRHHHAYDSCRGRQGRSQPAQAAFDAVVAVVYTAARLEYSKRDKADQGTDEVASDDSPRLCQRYFRYSVDEHSGGAL